MEVIIKRSKTRKPELRSQRSTYARLQVDLCGSLLMTLPSSTSIHPQNWESVLNGHPIFDSSASSSCNADLRRADDTSLELSINSLSKSKSFNAIQDEGIRSGRRRTMLIKDADLIVAVGKEIRMTSLTEFQLSASEDQGFKVRKSRNVWDQYVSHANLPP